MIRGHCSKNAIYLLQKLNFQCIIHQMKGIFTLPTDTAKSENTTKIKKWYAKIVIFSLHFSVVHISTNNELGNLNCCMHQDNIPHKGTVSQIFFI